MSEYYQDYFTPENLYKLEDNGHLFQMDLTARHWYDVSDKVSFDAEWIPLTESKFNNILFVVYIKTALWHIENSPELYKDNPIPNNVSRNLTFYSNGEMVLARDVNGNNFTCAFDTIHPFPNEIDITSFPTIPTYEVVPAIDYATKRHVALKDLYLYKDSKGDVYGISKDKKYYKLSKRLKRIDYDYDAKGKEKDWKSITYDEFLKEYEGYPEYINLFDLDRLSELHNYIMHSESEEGEKFGKEFDFFFNPYGAIYAIDENNDEYRCDQDGMRKLKKKCIDFSSWQNEDPILVLEDIKCYVDKKATLKSRKLGFLDLQTYQDEDDEVYGLSEDKRWFYLDQDTGEFEEIDEEKNIRDDNLQLYLKEELKENIKEQGECRLFRKIDEYSEKCINKLSNKGQYGTLCEFFIDDNKVIYGRDELLNEFILKLNSITPVKKGTIDVEKLYYIKENELFLHLKLFANDEE